ncbi:Calcipressin [Macrolepiota fuliginosa MF-IS2]|uniref:Calcipressin n=1 Tax=Macrolepiota fuliginosa MF-IS2 TaxID=1400762 RepID=A0A9P5XQ57_9AGAR|nr:Calcipressin [Macrolepiota fuliginosa MF-IS2]
MSSTSVTLSCGNSPVASPRAQSPDILRTNTLAVTSLPKSFFEPVILELLHTHFSSFGVINQWVTLPGFSRIIVVYEEEDHAETAKLRSDPIILSPTEQRSEELILRVYRADPNPLIPRDAESFIPLQNYLQPPVADKNFLISPPGSPPVGWESLREDPPNATPLADDLIEALRKLHVVQQQGQRKSSLEVLLEPDEASGVGVYVEDFDLTIGTGDEDMEAVEDDWVYGITAPARTKWKPIATAMPPMRTVLA